MPSEMQSAVLEGRVPVTIVDGGKTRTIFMQVIDPYQLCLYDTESARRPRFDINLLNSICETWPNDPSGRAVSVISPNSLIVLSFSSASDAAAMLTFFNLKSDIYKDRQSMQQLDRHLEKIWPFPLHE
jgi:hypothetical protein